MDLKLRELERQVACGNLNAKHRLFTLHIQLGLLKPVDPLIAEKLKKTAQDAAKLMDLAERRRGNKRLTPAQRKELRIKNKNIDKWRKHMNRRRKSREL